MRTQLIRLLTALALCASLHRAAAQGTAFTYQGRLDSSGSPATGNYDFTFALYNNSTGAGGQLGSTLTLPDVGVTNGMFMVTLDFGANFPGASRWLAIAVRTNGGAGFTALSPLQEFYPTPYAIYSASSASAGSVAASNISGTIPLGQLAGTVLTNGETGVTLSGTFTGNGGGFTNLAAWQLLGNTGNSNGNFLGTTDNQPLQIRVGGAQAGLITPSNGSANIVFGPAQNVISNGTASASILGGSNNAIGATSSFSLIGGGSQNTIQSSASYSVLGGGQQNNIDTSANSSFLGGGFLNSIQSGADHAVLGGGYFNNIETSANISFLGGGEDNSIQANSTWAFLGGGNQNSILPNAANAFLGGGQANFIEQGASYAAIVGGYGNTNTGFYAFIGDGEGNGIASGGQLSFLGGGYGNSIQGQNNYSFLGGGLQNKIQSVVGAPFLAYYAFLGGGQGNNVSGGWATVGGGYFNNASNVYATVPGGASNLASGQFSFAAGANAQATNSGAFVWADAEGTTFASTNANSFNVRANGGVRFVTGGAGLTVDGQPVLTNVPLAQLPASVVTNNEPSVSLGTLTLKSNLNFESDTILINMSMSFDSLLYADFFHDNFFAGIDAGFGIFGGPPSLSSPPLGGYGDTAIGNGALESITTGYQNTAIGAYPLQSNTTGNNNTAIGFESLYNVAGGSNNIGLGYDAGYNLSSGSNDIYIGNAGSGNESGVIRLGTPGIQANTFIAGVLNGDGGGLTNLSAAALPSTVVTNTETGVSFGFLTASTLVLSGNLLMSSPANISSDGATIIYTDVNGNSYFGADAGLANHGNSGGGNTGIGLQALSANSTGSSNIAVGFNAGASLTSGNNNIYIGNTGQNSESGVIRIGTEGTQTLVILPGDVMSDSLFTASIFCDGPINTTAAFSCCSITITGGCDLAEPFPVSNASQQVSEGAVMVIDEKNPGQLKLASKAYDTKVAGVVSGANGINPGIQMQQQGLLDGGRNVALTGRVYVQADAGNGAIEPGDLLTTSSSPGRAMKVSDHIRAQGAILGKAMTGLKNGQGMVLVLVTLQ